MKFQPAAYGIVCAYAGEANAQDHAALFVSSNGMGCFLSGHQHTSSFALTCENDLTIGLAALVDAAQPYADAVIDLINAIPNPVVYTQDCKDKIDAAQAAYDALTDGQKMFVSNYETLKNAPSDLIKAAPYVHILFKANGNEEKVENVTFPRDVVPLLKLP